MNPVAVAAEPAMADRSVVGAQQKLVRRRLSATAVEVGLSIVVLAFLATCALIPKRITSTDPTFQNLGQRIQPASSDHLLGTDKLGRDILSRIVHGARMSLSLAAITILIAGTVGITVGLVAGYYGGLVETVLMRITDIQLSLPPVLLAIVVVAVLGGSLPNLILVLAATAWVDYSRVVFSATRSLRERDFITCAKALGADDRHILVGHILRNQWHLIIIITVFQARNIILNEATLSFLGLGVQPPTPSWGNMVRDGYDLIALAPWLTIYPGIALFLAIYAINAIGEALRRRLGE
jgi:peptide/nickel transport system permease protein